MERLGAVRRFHFLPSAIWLIYMKLFGVIAFLLGTTVAATAAMIPLPRARPVDIPGDQSSTPRTEAVVSPCQSRLAEVAAFKPLPPITGPGDCTATAGVSLPSVTGNTKGVVGGGQVGCNYQFAPNWVIGIEGDGEAANIKGDVSDSVSFTNPLTGIPATVSGTARAQTDWIASVTGRLGWTWDRVMLYAKGGAAWAGDKYSADLPAFDEHIETSVTRPGWTVGGGVEWAFWDNWSAKVEYDYYDFSTRNLTLPGTIFGIPEVVPGVNVKETIQTVKFGINYRFGTY